MANFAHSHFFCSFRRKIAAFASILFVPLMLPSPASAIEGSVVPELEIFEIQGSGLVSAYDGTFVSVVNNTVTAILPNGFYIQTPDIRADGDSTTSNGIFVFTGSAPVVSVGEGVSLFGDVQERFGLTQITNISGLSISGAGDNVTVTTVSLPVAEIDEWENVESMWVTFPQTLHVSGNFNLGRFGEVDLALNQPLDNPTNISDPGVFAAFVQDQNDRSVIQLDDGDSTQNPLPLPPYIGESNTQRTGDTVDDLTGVVSYSFGRYEIIPTVPVEFTRVNIRPSNPPEVGGTLTVAAFNVQNYFTTIDNGFPVCGPLMVDGCRGADTSVEFSRQKSKLVFALTKLDADIVGIVELENAIDNTAIADLVDGLNAESGAGTYDYIATGAIGVDAIRVGIIYKAAVATPIGGFAVLDNSVNPQFNDSKNRPVLAQTFLENGTSSTVTVVVNHLKSKGSNCNSLGDFDENDGQGNCNLTRTAAASALGHWLSTDPTGTGETDPDYLIIGDLNAYAHEDPVVALEDAGYIDLVKANVGAGWTEGAYSFNFRSQSGYLDHALANASLGSRVTGAAFWHINADEPRALDYNNFNQPGLYTADEFRSSDHDPIVVGLCEDTPPEVEVSVSKKVLWPPNHRYARVTTVVSATDSDPELTIELISVVSNEPDNGQDDGDTIDDIVRKNDMSFLLRKERSGTGSGRIYTMTYRVTDSCDNSSIGIAEVTVPVSR